MTKPDMLFPVLSDLASTMLDDEKDHIDLFKALEPLLTRQQAVYLAAMLEICPIHYCDDQICRDDQDDCPAGRGQ